MIYSNIPYDQYKPNNLNFFKGKKYPFNIKHKNIKISNVHPKIPLQLTVTFPQPLPLVTEA